MRLMKKTVFSLCLSTALAASLVNIVNAQELPAAPAAVESQQPAAPIQMIPFTFADLAARLSPAVVNISTTQKMTIPEDFPELPQFPEGSPFQEFFEEFMNRRDDFSMAPATSLGSGFIIDSENGYIVTNNHVVRDAEEIQVIFSDDSTVSAELIGRDEKTDIAVLKVDAKNLKLVSVPFGNSDTMRVGDWIIAIGNPFGLGGTVTTGIVSARARDINSGPYDDFLQTDASINRGNSGGPMFNLNGEVIGINTAIFSPSGGSVGIGFAIPSAQASPVVRQIIQYGRTRRGWLGVRVQMVTAEIAESLGLEKSYGALVASITKGGPAEKAGIQQGDIILKFNDQIVQDMKYLPRFAAEAAINSEARLTYWRDGKEHETKIVVGELEKAEENGTISKTASPKSSGKSMEIDSVGLGLREMDESLRQEFEIADNIDGVVVTEVKNMSEAAIKGLAEGDVIVEINQQPVKSPEEVADLIDKAIQGGKKSVLLLLNSNGDIRFIALRLDKKDKTQPEEQEQELEP